MAEAAPQRPVRVWDLPTRLFHWILVGLLATSVTTGTLGELEWHFRSGYAVLALLLFRLAWGVVGSDTARFARFVRGPRAVVRYLRAGLAPGAEAGWPTAGHSPAGGWAVAAMLLVLCAQVGTGLFSNDDISSEGPLARFVSHATSRRITGWHHRTLALLLALAALHVTAVAGYRLVKRRDLVGPMITGRAMLAAGAVAPRLRSPLLAAIVFVAAAGAAWGVASLER